MATIAEQLTSLANTKTAIKDAIVAKGVAVADTDPFSAYPAKIGQISGGGGAPATKFGASVDTFIGDVNENGVLQMPTGDTHLDFRGVKQFAASVFYYRFYKNQSITSVDLSSLTNIISYGFYYTFNGCLNLTSVDLSSLTTIEDTGCRYAFSDCRGLTRFYLPSLVTIASSALYYTCQNCYSLTSVDLRLLTKVGSYGMYSAFSNCSKLISVNLSSLTTIEGTNSMQYSFSYCAGLIRVDFPSLTSVSKSAFGTNAFNQSSNITEIHFRADAQVTIEALTGYSSKFGATNATIYFDLVGTITVNGVAYARNEPNSIYVDDTKTYVAWKDESDNIVYTDATAEPEVGTIVYSDEGTTQVGTVEGVA